MSFLFKYYFQKSSLLIYKSWVFTISFFIIQNIHFADVLIKYKIFLVKNNNFLVHFFFKCRLRSYINLDFLQFLFISSKIYILQIYLKNLKYIKLKKLKTVWKTFYLCRLRLLIIFIFLFNSENISFYHLYC